MNADIKQWIGKRECQEDACAVRHYPGGTLAIVCDGMGGHSFGDMASRVAADAFIDFFETNDDMPMATRLEESMYYANEKVGKAFAGTGSFGGTTLLAVYIGGGVMWWTSVGDSPLYLWRRGRLIRLNADHSLREVYMQYVKAGSMSYEEAVMRGHVLRSAVTGESVDMVDTPAIPHPLLPGDRVLLTTDGTDDLLYTPVVTDEVRALLNNREGDLAEAIVRACEDMQHPMADNVTVIALDWDAPKSIRY